MNRAHWQVMGRVFQFQGKMRLRYIAGLILSALELTTLLLSPAFNRSLTAMASGTDLPHIVRDMAIVAVLLIALAPVVAFGKYLQSSSCAYGVQQMRNRLFEHALTLPPAEAVHYHSGDMIARLSGDIARSGSMFQSFAIVSAVRFVVVSIVTFLLLCLADVRIALLAVVYNAVSLTLAAKLNPYVRRLEQDARDQMGKSLEDLVEALRNQPILRVFLLQTALAAKYAAACGIIKQKQAKFRTLNGFSYAMTDMFTFSAPVVGFFLGLWLGSATGNEFAQVVYIATTFALMADASHYGSTFLLLIQPSIVASKRVLDILDAPTEADHKTQTLIQSDFPDALTLQGLTFTYQQVPVFTDVSFTIDSTKHIAIAGGSGSGKSTLLKVLAGIYDPQQGVLQYFGADYQALSRRDIRLTCAYVSQDSMLFEGSIAENIALGREGATLAQIQAAAEAVGLHHWITSLPQGYNAPVGERGGMLSGGQRQRIGIARALLKDAPMLLLDEATSALDATTEELVMQNIRTLRRGRALICVAHRLKSVQDMDEILIMQEGRLCERGNHNALMEAKGSYYQLYHNTNQAK